MNYDIPLMLRMLRGQYAAIHLLATPEMCAGGTYIVTGSNTGIGFEVAKILVSLNPRRVIMAVRSMERGQAAADRIEAETGIKGIAEVWELDMSSFNSIKAFAHRVDAELDRIDALIENAGISQDKWEMAGDAEMSVAVNLYGTLLLALLLLPKMRESVTKFGIIPHVTCVTSGLGLADGAGYFQTIQGSILGSLNDEAASTGHMHQRYPHTKLLQIFVYREFAKLMPFDKTGVIINLISPGLSWTGLTKDNRKAYMLQVRAVNTMVGRHPEKGARTILHAATMGADSHGKLLSDNRIVEHWIPEWLTNSNGQKIQKQLWQDTIDKLEAVAPGVASKALQL